MKKSAAEDKSEPFEVFEGSGNAFADFGIPDPEMRLARARLAGEIIRIMNERQLTVRAAAELTGITPADISRIRNADLSRFTIDRLMRVLTRLNGKVKVLVGDEAA
ncbi:MAG: helix-turn-helix domain-containing protein [Rhizobiaceae bacterium]|jgi:predicted XRE-type DNA-binding protein|nr:helix-turn-helix domain-containing protein [Rhizobiaceae bacterium]